MKRVMRTRDIQTALKIELLTGLRIELLTGLRTELLVLDPHQFTVELLTRCVVAVTCDVAGVVTQVAAVTMTVRAGRH